MKKLLLMTNGVLICMAMVCCTPKNKKLPVERQQEETVKDDKTAPRAIEHSAPEQEKIDSIKAVKLEERKKMKSRL